MKTTNLRKKTVWLCTTAMFMALNVALSSFGVPVPGGHLYMNDIVICLASIILDPLAAFLVGGVGAFLGDLFFYPAPMFVSLVTHGLQAVVISLFAHHVLKKRPVISSAIGVTIGAVIMVVGYSLGRAFIYNTPEYAVMKLPYQILQAVVGAVAGMLLCWGCGLYKLWYRFSGESIYPKTDKHFRRHPHRKGAPRFRIVIRPANIHHAAYKNLPVTEAKLPGEG